MNFLARLFSYVVNDRVFRFLSKFYKNVRWQGMKRRFASVGKGSFIEAPWLITNPQHIVIGECFSALSMLRMETVEEYLGERFSPRIVIGDNVAFNNDCHIGCINRIVIGNNVLGASRIYITDHYHGRIEPEDLDAVPTQRRLHSKGPVIIGDNVWIGENVTILPGVTIGESAIIGANTVVSKDVPAYAVAAGVPARVIRQLKEQGAQ